MAECIAAFPRRKRGAGFGEEGVEVELADLPEQGAPGCKGEEEGAGGRAGLDLDRRGEAGKKARAAAGLDRVERKELGPGLSWMDGVRDEAADIESGVASENKGAHHGSSAPMSPQRSGVGLAVLVREISTPRRG
jgi:hypothetical protein